MYNKRSSVNVFLYCTSQVSAYNLIVLLRVGLASSNSSGTTSGNETDLTTSTGATLDGGRLTDVLMITTTVRMLHGIHSNTTNLEKFVKLSNTARKRRKLGAKEFYIRSVKKDFHLKLFRFQMS